MEIIEDNYNYKKVLCNECDSILKVAINEITERSYKTEGCDEYGRIYYNTIYYYRISQCPCCKKENVEVDILTRNK